MRGRAALLRAIVAMVLVAGGACSDDGPEGRPGRPTTTTAGLAPEGALRLAVGEEPASLDPFDRGSRTQAAGAILGAVLPQLFRVEPDGRVRGFLADDATVREEAGAAGATFSLRDGAVWSDGTPITTADVRFTLETVLGGAWPGPRAGYDRIRAVEGEGARVRFRFDGPFPGWRRLFSGPDFVLPAHRLAGRTLDREWDAGPDVAGGPFELAGTTPGLEVVLGRNDRWWGRPAGVSAVRVLVVPDSRTMEQLLARGEIDLAWPGAFTNRRGRFGALDGVEVSVAPAGGRVVSLVANTVKLGEERRRALLALLDRDRFVEVLLEGEAVPAPTLAGPEAAGAGGAWRELTADTALGGIPRNAVDTVVASEELDMAGLLGRALESQVRTRRARLELEFAPAPLVQGTWLPDGRFDLAVVEEVAWPEPCWRCWFGSESVGTTNVARIEGLDPLALGAEQGDAEAVAALEANLRDSAVLLPLWRPSALLAGKGVEGAEANSWSGPLWAAERWSLRR